MACDGVLSSTQDGMIPWSLQPTKIASHLGRGMWCGVSSLPWPLQVAKSGSWDQHRTCIIWEAVRNTGSQASPRQTRACIFTRSPVGSMLSSVWEALSWRKLSDLLWPHHWLPFAATHLPSGRTLFWEHSDLGSGLYFIDLCTDQCCWDLLKFLKFLGSSPLEKLTLISLSVKSDRAERASPFYGSVSAGSGRATPQSVVRVRVGTLEVGPLSLF